MTGSSKSQSDFFLNGEGDAWYLRNQNRAYSTSRHSKDIDFICKTLESSRKSIQNILEIGCGAGQKLITLSNYFDASGSGIDPSSMAIENARKIPATNHSNLNFAVGRSIDLAFSDNSFDLVLFGFCLYLIPPSETFKSIAEADRVLKNGGFLAILDFDYGGKKINPYHHADGISTFKNDYSNFFTSSGYYSLVSKWSYSHESEFFTPVRDERIAIEILYKECN